MTACGLVFLAALPLPQERERPVFRISAEAVQVDFFVREDGRAIVSAVSVRPPTALPDEDVDIEAFLAGVQRRLGVTLGPRGCTIRNRDVGYHQLAAPVVEALDTTGAGDVFHGAFLNAFLKTGSAVSSARFANVAAARKGEGMTARAPIPPEEEIWRLARR